MILVSCVCVCVRACVRACVCACVCIMYMYIVLIINQAELIDHDKKLKCSAAPIGELTNHTEFRTSVCEGPDIWI